MIQRLVSVYHVKYGTYKSSSWARFFNYWKNAHRRLVSLPIYNRTPRQMRQTFINGYIGEYTDLETITAFRNLFFGHSGKLSVKHQLNFSSDIYGFGAEKYFFSSDEHIPTQIILLDVNLRLESPVLNIKIRKLIEEKSVNTKVIGFYANLNYEVEHLLGAMRAQKDVYKLIGHDKALLVCGSTTHIPAILAARSGSVYKV